MFKALGEGLALGLATGTACLASCGPVYASYLLGEKRRGWQSLRIILILNAGRLFAYAGFGAIMGLVGGLIPYSIRIPVAYSGYILFSAYLILYVVRLHRSCSGCGVSKFLKITRSPLLLGVLTGFSICPSFLIAMTSAFESSGPLSGVLLFTGFFGGTTVYMLPFAVFGLLTSKEWLTTAARVLAVVVAVYFGIIGIRGLAGWIGSGAPATSNVDMSSDGEDTYTFAIQEADSIFILTFRDDPADYGAEFASDLEDSSLPPLVVLETDSSTWHADIAAVPELSAVVAPAWVDERSGIQAAAWQDSAAQVLREARARVFAIEYQPYCSATPALIMDFLKRYRFKTEVDSGFVFYMANPEDPSDCATCPLAD